MSTVTTNMRGRSFLSLADFTPEEIVQLLDLSADTTSPARKTVGATD